MTWLPAEVFLMIKKNVSILCYRNSQMLDEDNIINETSESSVINLPDKTTGASQPERSTEVTKTQTTTTDSVVRNKIPSTYNTFFKLY
jgi:hypothetical protein